MKKHDHDKRFIQKHFFKKDSEFVLMIVYSQKESEMAEKIKEQFVNEFNILMVETNIYESLLKIQSISSKEEIRDILTKASIIWEKMKADFSHAHQYTCISIGDGCWTGMQTIMRRHECKIFAAIDPNFKHDDFLFFTPAPCSGVIVYKDPKNLHSINALKEKMIFEYSGRDILVENIQDDEGALVCIKEFFEKHKKTAFIENIDTIVADSQKKQIEKEDQ